MNNSKGLLSIRADNEEHKEDMRLRLKVHAAMHNLTMGEYLDTLIPPMPEEKTTNPNRGFFDD